MDSSVDIYMSGTEIKNCGKAVHIVNRNNYPESVSHIQVPKGYFRLSYTAMMVREYLRKL